MTSQALARFLAPRSVAVVGASRNFDTIQGRPLHMLRMHGFPGALYGVNPRYEDIDGIPCYPNIGSIPDTVDLAIIVVAAKSVLDVLRQCVDNGVGSTLVISSGFAESGEEGRALQQEIRELCKRTGLRVSGPNAQGFLNLKDHVAATFSPAVQVPNLLAGHLGFVSQSGAFGFSTFCLGQEKGIGFSHVVSTGNEADITWLDAVEYLLDDAGTRTVAAYVEGIRDGGRFPVLAEKALSAGKPLLVLKVGRTAVGSKAAASHTAAMTGADAVFDAACRQYGVQRVHDVFEIFDYAQAFDAGRRTTGDRLGIMTTSGGAGVMAADEAVDLGLVVGELSDAVRREIDDLLPAFGSSMNPVDITAEVMRRPESFRKTLQLMLDDDTVDMVAIVITMVTGEQAMDRAKDIVEITQGVSKPVVVSWSVSEALAGPALDYMREHQVPLYSSPVRAVHALNAVRTFALAVETNKTGQRRGHDLGRFNVSDDVKAPLFSGRGVTEFEAKRLLSCYGVPVTNEQLVTTPAEAALAADSIGYPVVVKVVARDLQHKTQSGGVRLNLTNSTAVEEAATSILDEVKQKEPGATIEGFLVQEMVVGGTEMILGLTKDAELGSTVMLGAGGIFVEIIQDVAYRLVPIDRADAQKMVDELKISGILAGARGRTPGDCGALVDALCSLSALAVDFGDTIQELEINPLIVLPDGQGVCAVDALVVPGENTDK